MSVKLVIMVEVGTSVREMDPMKKKVREKVFLNEYGSIICEIPNECVDGPTVQQAMLQSFKGTQKKEMDGGLCE